jgi:hypothetical protein
MERPRPGDVPPATATRTISIMIQHDLWILRSRSIVKAYSVLAGRSGSCDREDPAAAGQTDSCANIYLLAQLRPQQIDHRTTVCKVGDLEYTRP